MGYYFILYVLREICRWTEHDIVILSNYIVLFAPEPEVMDVYRM